MRDLPVWKEKLMRYLYRVPPTELFMERPTPLITMYRVMLESKYESVDWKAYGVLYTMLLEYACTTGDSGTLAVAYDFWEENGLPLRAWIDTLFAVRGIIHFDRERLDDACYMLIERRNIKPILSNFEDYLDDDPFQFATDL